MKRFLLSTAFAVLATAGAAFANTPSVAVADIPYEFVANGKTLPAGRYSVEIQPFVLKLTDASGKTAVVASLPKFQKTAARPVPGIFLKRENGKMHLVGVREPNSSVLRVLGTGM